MKTPKMTKVRRALTLACAGLLLVGAIVNPVAGSTPAHASETLEQPPHTYYALEGRQGVSYKTSAGKISSPAYASIRKFSYDPATQTVIPDNEQLGGLITLPARNVDDLESGIYQHLYQRANSLGAAGDGTFYFTAQHGDEAREANIDIYRFQVDESQPDQPGVLTRVEQSFGLNSNGGGVLVGGAMNPRDNNYYFMYFSSFMNVPAAGANIGYPEGDDWTRVVRAHLYRFDPNQYEVNVVNSANGAGVPEVPATGEVAHFDVLMSPDMPLFTGEGDKKTAASLNGDIDFDHEGNLLMVTSLAGKNAVEEVPAVEAKPGSSGSPAVEAKPAVPGIPAESGRAMMASLDFEDFGYLLSKDPMLGPNSNPNSVPTLVPTSTLGGNGQAPLLNAISGASAYNGIAFTPERNLIIQQGNRQAITNPNTFNHLGEPQLINERTTVPGDTVQLSYLDLATHAAPAQISASARVTGEPFDLADNFALAVDHHIPSFKDVSVAKSHSAMKTPSVHTVGTDGGNDVAAVSAVRTVLPDGDFTVALEGLTNAEHYTITHECFVRSSSGQRGDLILSGTGPLASFSYQDVPNVALAHQRMHCDFALAAIPPTPEAPAAPESGAPGAETVVSAGSEPASGAAKLSQTGAADGIPSAVIWALSGAGVLGVAFLVLGLRKRRAL